MVSVWRLACSQIHCPVTKQHTFLLTTVNLPFQPAVWQLIKECCGSYQYQDTAVWQCAVSCASTSSVSADHLCTSPLQRPPSQRSGNYPSHAQWQYNMCRTFIHSNKPKLLLLQGFCCCYFLPWLWWWAAGCLCCQSPWGWLGKTDPCWGMSLSRHLFSDAETWTPQECTRNYF